MTGGPAVRLATVEDGGPGWMPDLYRRLATVESTVADLLEGELSTLARADRLTIVPDVHYPFHPSTGMVTDPAVVGAILAVLERADARTDVAVAGTSDEFVSLERTADYLGYRDVLERFDADVVDLADEPRVAETVAVGDESVEVRVPERLRDGAVVLVPTLRPNEADVVAGGMRTLARVAGVGTDPVDAVGATRSIDPDCSVLDATTVYAGRPHAGSALLAGPPAPVDAVATALLEREIGDDDVLSLALEDASIEIDRVGTDVPDLETLRERLPAGGLPPADSTHPAVSAAYRLYAAIAGDAVPPQLEARR